MRWDHLRTEAGAGDHEGTLFGLDRVAVRQFDTPEFRGMTFYEVHARSAINRVPAAARVPFEWTINPYRGCSHACVYCLYGSTPVLLANGHTKPISEVQVGDLVVGTAQVGPDRQYTITPVLAHWQTEKLAYRITLEDGTDLLASGDHRFLTKQGWKHVTNSSEDRETAHI